jgi:hypothetical protein
MSPASYTHFIFVYALFSLYLILFQGVGDIDVTNWGIRLGVSRGCESGKYGNKREGSHDL